MFYYNDFIMYYSSIPTFMNKNWNLQPKQVLEFLWIDMQRWIGTDPTIFMAMHKEIQINFCRYSTK